MSHNETEQIAVIFRNLGADKEQAIMMARQLIKRARTIGQRKKLDQSQ